MGKELGIQIKQLYKRIVLTFCSCHVQIENARDSFFIFDHKIESWLPLNLVDCVIGKEMGYFAHHD
jgi:hypothetical protein